MLYGWYAPRTRRFPACPVSVPGGQTLKSGKRAMTTNFARRHMAGVALIAALAGCGGSKEAKPADTARTTHDSAAGNVATSGPRDTTYGPANNMGRIPVLEYHVIAPKE